jgi:acyl-CoA synthetase (AMP-forming)/AMP-acid ligase II
VRRPPLFLRPISAGVGDLYSTWEESTELVGGLRRLAQEHLARFAYPHRVLFDALSRNSSGKVDRAATRRRFGEGGTATC